MGGGERAARDNLSVPDADVAIAGHSPEEQNGALENRMVGTRVSCWIRPSRYVVRTGRITGMPQPGFRTATSMVSSLWRGKIGS